MVKQADVARKLKNLKPDDTAQGVLLQLLVDGLTGRKAEIYNLVIEAGEPVTSRYIVERTIDLKQNATINILSRLRDLGVIQRTNDANGKNDGWVTYWSAV